MIRYGKRSGMRRASWSPSASSKSTLSISFKQSVLTAVNLYPRARGLFVHPVHRAAARYASLHLRQRGALYECAFSTRSFTRLKSRPRDLRRDIHVQGHLRRALHVLIHTSRLHARTLKSKDRAGIYSPTSPLAR